MIIKFIQSNFNKNKAERKKTVPPQNYHSADVTVMINTLFYKKPP